MKQTRAKKRKGKKVWVIESDKQNKAEISELFAHQSHWQFSFFQDLASLKKTESKPPMAILVDIDHLGVEGNNGFETSKIQKLKENFPDSEILVFAEPEHEKAAMDCLGHGALDYILVGPHQFKKLEFELRWLEDVLEERQANKGFINKLLILIGFMILFIVLVVYLYESGILKEGTDTNVLIGI